MNKILSHKKILVVDDEPDIVEIIMEDLTKKGYQVLGATNGADAIILNEKGNPALIVLDLFMPEMDGIETLRHIRKKDNKVKVIILTGVSTLLEISDTIKDVADLNVSECLTKPIDDNDQLLHVIRDVLER